MRRAVHAGCMPGCHALTRDRFCEAHKKTRERDRLAPSRRGYNARWQCGRLAFLAAHPTCECPECVASGAPLMAEVVDHIKPHKGDQKLFWDKNNWQAMSKRCHDRKTAREDGGFGNTPGR